MFLDKVIDYFKKDVGPPQGEIGFEESVLYRTTDFQRYDPDRLKINKGVKVYAEMMFDDQVKAVLQFKIHAVLSRGWYFDIGLDDQGKPKSEHEEMARFFEHMIGLIQGSWNDKLKEMLSALQNGYAVIEKVFTPIEWEGRTMWGIKDLKLRPAQTFTGGFHTDSHGNVVQIIQQMAGNDIKIPLEKVIHFVHQPDVDRQYGQSDLRAAYRPYWSKDNIIKFQNIHLERHASGFIKATKKGNITPTQEKDLKDFIKNAGARMGVMIPENIELELIPGTHSESYEKAIAQHDKSIAKSVLVPNLLGITEQGATGSFAQSKTQLEAFFWVLDNICLRKDETLDEQLFRDLAMWNFGTNDYPHYKSEPISDTKKESIAKAWADLMQKGAVSKSDSDESHLRSLLGFPAKEEPEAEEVPEELPEQEPWIEDQPEDIQEFIRKEFQDKPWLKRVDFGRMESVWNDRDEKFSKELAQVMGTVGSKIENQIVKIAGDRSFGNIALSEFKDVAIPKNLVSEIRKVTSNNLKEMLDASYEMARRELPSRIHAKLIQPGMDRTQAEKFLASKSFKIAGVVEQDTLKAVQNVLANSITYDKNLSQTIQSMRDDTNLVELLPATDAGGRAINVPARLENIARTNDSDAVNRARQSLFGQPEFKGFIQAFEYSAILDSRTTEICRHLNAKIMKQFDTYTPPNHYMCRSILIAVTVVDDWNGKESAKPRMEPQAGFY